MEKPHIGKLIQRQMENEGRKVSWLAAKLNCSRNCIYQIYQKDFIDTDKLLKISMALNIDFFQFFTEYIARETSSCKSCIEKNDIL